METGNLLIIVPCLELYIGIQFLHYFKTKEDKCQCNDSYAEHVLHFFERAFSSKEGGLYCVIIKWTLIH